MNARERLLRELHDLMVRYGVQGTARIEHAAGAGQDQLTVTGSIILKPKEFVPEHPDTVRLETLVRIGTDNVTDEQREKLDALEMTEEATTLEDFRKWLDVAGEALK